MTFLILIASFNRITGEQHGQGHLEERYGAEMSPALISSVTDAVSDDVKAWQAGPLDALYPILCLARRCMARHAASSRLARACHASRSASSYLPG
jgi:transposase-like protein